MPSQNRLPRLLLAACAAATLTTTACQQLTGVAPAAKPDAPAVPVVANDCVNTPVTGDHYLVPIRNLLVYKVDIGVITYHYPAGYCVTFFDSLATRGVSHP